MSREILLVPHNHFDPTWRRCFDRKAVFNGSVVRSYAEVEQHVINAWRRLAARGYTFYEGQAAVLRKYLERNQAARRHLQSLMKKGLFDVLLGGEVVQDTVLPAAEGLVRNFLAAAPFYREFAGESHPGLKIATCEDAFGNSPNYPQVLRGVGAEAVTGLSYRPLAEDVWVGIDGSKILNMDRHPGAFFGAFAKHAPCPSCRGRGCHRCRNTGLLFVDGFDIPALRRVIKDCVGRSEPWVKLLLLTEEVRPDSRVADLVESMNGELRGRSRVRFASVSEIYGRVRPALMKSLAKRDDRPSADLNPAQPGCMVSRIALKQRTRATTYHLICAESAVANAAWRKGRPFRPPPAFARAWRLVAFNQFHDAITGTHIDSANRELHDMLDRADAVADRYFPLPRRRNRPAGLKPLGEGATVRKLGRLTVKFDRRGIVSILCGGRDLFSVNQPLWNNTKRPFRIAELWLEPDYGDPWGRRIAPPGSHGWDDFSVIQLGDYHTRLEASAEAIRWRGRYSGGDPKIRRLSWVTTVTPSADGRRLDFRTEVDWDTGSRRLRVVVPIASDDPTATYEVPFGFIDRTYDPARLVYGAWDTHPMEFPTLHWVRKEVGNGNGVALLNRGLPCYRWMPGKLDLSLVRSPEWAFCLVEPASYEFWDIDGMRDAGRHVFEYSLLPYTDGLTPGELTRIGYEYNMPGPISLPFEISGDIVVTAWKLAEDGSGWILRVQDAGGKGTVVSLAFGEERSVTVTDLLERPQEETVRTRKYRRRLHRHGILTLLVR